jgi:hypothetical protein
VEQLTVSNVVRFRDCNLTVDFQAYRKMDQFELQQAVEWFIASAKGISAMRRGGYCQVAWTVGARDSIDEQAFAPDWR